MNAQSPIVSEFETTIQAKAYESWLREKVSESLADESPMVPHDEAMSKARKAIKKNSRAKTNLAR